MMTKDNVKCWCAVRTGYKSERKLMQRLNAAGYTAFCPMQTVYMKWNGHTKEVVVPLFAGCFFVEDTTDATAFVTLQNAALLVDNDGKKLSICADKAELPAKFIQLLK